MVSQRVRHDLVTEQQQDGKKWKLFIHNAWETVEQNYSCMMRAPIVKEKEAESLFKEPTTENFPSLRREKRTTWFMKPKSS